MEVVHDTNDPDLKLRCPVCKCPEINPIGRTNIKRLSSGWFECQLHHVVFVEGVRIEVVKLLFNQEKISIDSQDYYLEN